MTFYEFEKMMEEDEKNIQANPCCRNCKYYVEDYGMYDCAIESPFLGIDDLENWDPDKDICSQWKSCITGNSREE